MPNMTDYANSSPSPPHTFFKFILYNQRGIGVYTTDLDVNSNTDSYSTPIVLHLTIGLAVHKKAAPSGAPFLFALF